MTNPPSADQTCFGQLVLALWNFALGEPAEDRIPQGENLKFVCNLVLGVWDFIDSIAPADSLIKERPYKPLLGPSRSSLRAGGRIRTLYLGRIHPFPVI
jgi:hypothetical protein